MDAQAREAPSAIVDGASILGLARQWSGLGRRAHGPEVSTGCQCFFAGRSTKQSGSRRHR